MSNEVNAGFGLSNVNKLLIFLAIGTFAVGCNTFLLAGLVPQVGQTLGQPVAVIGQAMSVFSLTYLLSATCGGISRSFCFAQVSCKIELQECLRTTNSLSH